MGLGLVGCRAKDTPQSQNSSTGATETVQIGDASFVVSIDKRSVRVAEPFNLTIEATAPATIETELADLRTQLEEQFVIRDHSPLTAEESEGQRRLFQSYELESNVSGLLALPAFSFAVGEEEASTAPLSLEVVSALESAEDADLSAPADIESPLALLEPRGWTPFLIAGGAAVALALMVWLFVRSRAAKERFIPPPPPPHIWALAQLEKLLNEKLVEGNQVHEFYFRLSGIVRTYIELRFCLMAPERTTQEFLNEAQRSSALRFGHKDLLREFLVACDMVKFARHEPGGAEIDMVIGTARGFIEETVPESAAISLGEAT